ncbi:VIT domain-containing protein [Lysobacter humi (ex Lee et al. 2017)]
MRKILVMALMAVALSLPSAYGQERHLTAPPLMTTPEPGGRVELESAAFDVDSAGGAMRTSIDMTFRNRGTRTLEGRLEFPLAPGQQVVGFALDVDGRMRDAVPVPKAKGRQVFESIERRGVDPGLLEQTAGESFRLRVFPFAPGGTRRVRIVLLETLDARGSASLPVHIARGLGEIPVQVRADAPVAVDGLLRDVALKRAGMATRLLLRPADVPPARPVRLRFAAAAGPRVQVQHHEDARYFVAEIPVAAAARPRTLPRRMGLVWDSSTSGRARAHDLELALLDAYFAKAGDVEVHLVRLRDRAEPAVRYVVRGGDWRELRRTLERSIYDGATATVDWRPDPAVGEYLLFGDGLFNYGDAPFPAFGPRQRLHAVSTTATADIARLRALTDARGGRTIVLRDAAGLDDARQALLLSPTLIEQVEGTGVADLVAESTTVEQGVVRIAGRIVDADARVSVVLADGRRLDVPLRGAREGDLAAPLWARYSIAQLGAEPARNRARIAAIGQRFSLVTPETSLLVLENLDDYVRYEIEPPADLRADYARLRGEIGKRRDAGMRERIDRVAEQWADRVAWWERAFPKDAPRKPAVTDGRTGGAVSAAAEDAAMAADAAAASAQRESRERAESPAALRAMAPPPAPAPVAAEANTLDTIVLTGSRIASDGFQAPERAATAAIVLQPWQSDSPSARRLREAAADDVYDIYLDERDAEPRGTAFFLDAADVLAEKGRTALALRVLSNLAELQLEDRHVLRVLAYRLMHAGRADLAIPVLRQVLAMAGEEPQSQRDLGLAHAAAGERQAAIDALYEVVRGDWDGRFPDIEITALAELNAIIATAPRPLDTQAIDARLLRALPLDLRAVLSWDSDASDMDLWVTDPNGEKAYYGNRLTYQGGRMSSDFTGGYGPEEFALRTAKKGRYRVEANFFGERQPLVTGATTLQLWLSTGFGTPRQKDRTVTLRLKQRSETVFVGEFEVE